MNTLIVQIGNSDDKLTQKEWSDYYCEVDWIVAKWSKTIHFSGCSNGASPWQNACWVFDISNENCSALAELLKDARVKFRQDSAALSFVGETKFI